jgi:hypothetical protein
MINIPDNVSESWVNFMGKNNGIFLNPGSMMEKFGFGINIPDP